MAEIRVTRAYFDATSDSPDEEVAAELPRHPVFRLIPRHPAKGALLDAGAHERA